MSLEWSGYHWVTTNTQSLQWVSHTVYVICMPHEYGYECLMANACSWLHRPKAYQLRETVNRCYKIICYSCTFPAAGGMQPNNGSILSQIQLVFQKNWTTNSWTDPFAVWCLGLQGVAQSATSDIPININNFSSKTVPEKDGRINFRIDEVVFRLTCGEVLSHSLPFQWTYQWFGCATKCTCQSCWLWIVTS